MRLGFVVLFPGKDPVHLVSGGNEKPRRIDVADVREVAQVDVGLHDFAQRCLLVEQLPEAAVAVGQIIGVAGQRALLALVLQIGELELFGQDAAEVVRAGFHFVLAALALPRARSAGPIRCPHGLLADDLAFFPVPGAAGGFVLLGAEGGVVEKFLLHRGGYDHDLLLAALAGFDEAADVDLARKAVFFALFVALEQFVDGADIGAHRALHGGHALQHVRIVVGVEILAKCVDPGARIRPPRRGKVVGAAGLELALNPSLLRGLEPSCFQARNQFFVVEK